MSAKREKSNTYLGKLNSLMDEWPESWAGSDDDIEIGSSLVCVFRDFIEQLHEKGLTKKTLRKHLDNSWVIGGEIIREVVERPFLRKKKARQLLLSSVENGEAPYLYGESEHFQKSLDSTARKLLRFLSESNVKN